MEPAEMNIVTAGVDVQKDRLEIEVSELGLRCPKCGGKTEVKETRAADGAILRRRNCTQCGHRKTARETWI